MATALRQVVARVSVACDPRADSQLIASFIHTADHDAFAELVHRHGPTVLGVCQRFLGATPDAEDAFQATFLVLVRRARGTEWRASLGPWLYGVALRVARKARAVRARRLANERRAPAMAEAPTTPIDTDDSAAVLDEELAALPVAYRAALVLCEIQGASRRVAAHALGVTEGTLSSRLARGRKMLRARLARRGVAPALTGLAVTVPARLAGATVRNAVSTLNLATSTVPAGIMSLTEGTVKAMVTKGNFATVVVAVCLGLCGFGTWRATAGTVPQPPASAASAAPQAAAAAPKQSEQVATIFGNVPVTRDEFTEHLLRRYGKKELEAFVRKQIITHAFGRTGKKLAATEIEAGLESDWKALGVTRDEFVAKMLTRYGKTLESWTEDVIVPRVMLSRLLKQNLPAPTEAELRQAFDAKFGEKIACQVITWKKDEAAVAQKAYEKVRDNASEFDAQATRHSEPNLSAPRGHIAPVSRTLPLDAPLNAAHTAACKLKPGEVSELLTTDDGFLVVKCTGTVPADKGKSFEAERTALLVEVVQKRTNDAIPKLFRELEGEAKPVYQLTFSEAKPLAPTDPVATIFGTVKVTRGEFVAFLIRRYGPSELKPFVNNRIVTHAFAQKGWKLTPAEVEASLDETCAALKMTRAQLAKEILKNTGKTLEAWNEDMMVPNAMIARLCKARLPVPTEAELRQAFDVKYGEKLDCRIILWTSEDEARKEYEKVRESEKEFDAHARRCATAHPNQGIAADGRAEAIPRAQPLEDHKAERQVHAAVAKLQPGEVSALVAIELEGRTGFIALKCDRVVPADKTRSFEKEKLALLTDVANAKIGNEAPKLHADLMKQAKPQYHLTFPEPAKK